MATETTTKTSFWSTLWNWIKQLFGKVEETGFSTVIDWIKTKFGEAKVTADKKNFSSWAEYIIALLTDLFNWATSSTTSMDDSVPTKSGAPKKVSFKTSIVKELYNKKK